MSNKIYIYSGAGISAESGIPTFRGKNGLWENYKIDDICNIDTWRQNYDMVHEFYNKGRKKLKEYTPNKAHYLVAELQERFGVDNVVNITTNIDDLFERAGVKNTVYLHGNLTKMKDIKTGEIFNVGYNDFDYKSKERERYKPNVIFFGEQAPNYDVIDNIMISDISKDDVFIYIGMSFIVIPTYRIVPYENKHLININKDKNTHRMAFFHKEYTCNASEGLAKAIEEVINPRFQEFISEQK